MSAKPIKRGDSGITLADHLAVQGVSVDLEDATVYIVIRSVAGEVVVVDQQAHILQTGTDQDKSEPNVEWTPENADDLDVAVGVYNVEWHVALRGGRPVTLPRGGFRKIKIVEKLRED